ncbi:hypothetical protein WG66_016167 [Moniliophthora roreri]|nr:hypothetical protein WG66_016167 [Moniliophthora roreri]
MDNDQIARLDIESPDTYWTAFPLDGIHRQILVYSLYLLETGQTISLTYDAFQNFVFGFASPSALEKINNLWLDTYLFDGLVAFFVQLYFAYGIHMLLKSNRLVGVIVLLTVVQCAGGIAVGILAKTVPSISRPGQVPSFVPALLWLSCATLTNILIAVSMIYALFRHDTTLKSTRNIISRLHRLAMETGSVAAAMTIVTIVLFLTHPEQIYHITPAMTLAKIYSNSLLVIFNSRIRIYGARDVRQRLSIETGRRRNTRATANQNAVIPLSTPRSRVDSGSSAPSTFPSSLEVSDSYGLTTKSHTSETES